jgi:N-acetylmuramoyl-L-alanine amidase
MNLRSVTAILLCLVCLGSHAAVVEDLRTYRSPEYTRLVFDLSGTIDHRIFTLDDPDRVVIDLVSSELLGSVTDLDLAGTPIRQIRSAVRNNSDVRVVLDLDHKVQPRSFILARNEQYGDRLVIDLYDPDAATSSNVPLTAEELDETQRDIVVAISAGHGGEDPGAIGVGKLQEKKVVLEIAREVAALLNSTPGFRAVMIRDGDYYVGLRQRVETGHRSSADLYIAIHADAHTNDSAQGATIYALSQRGATSEQARVLAEKENASDLIGGVGSISLTDKDEVLASVLLDLSMTGSIATSLEIGDQLISRMGDVIKMRRKKVEQAAFVELKSADIPSLLIESGYITNKNDAKNLDSPIWRQRFAGAVVDGITSWFYDRPPRGSWVSWQKEHGGLPVLASTYTVRRGDTLSQIAERHHVSMADLKAANGMTSNTVRIDQVLKIPGASPIAPVVMLEHKISRGETLSGIAENYSVPVSMIRETNNLKSDNIRIGQILKIPTS